MFSLNLSSVICIISQIRIFQSLNRPYTIGPAVSTHLPPSGREGLCPSPHHETLILNPNFWPCSIDTPTSQQKWACLQTLIPKPNPKTLILTPHIFLPCSIDTPTSQRPRGPVFNALPKERLREALALLHPKIYPQQAAKADPERAQAIARAHSGVIDLTSKGAVFAGT